MWMMMMDSDDYMGSDSDSDSFFGEADDMYSIPLPLVLSKKPANLNDVMSNLLDETRSEREVKMASLLDLSAMVVAKTNDCEQLEMCEPPLDEALLKKVAYWAFPQDEKQVMVYASVSDKGTDWDRGLSMVREGRVKEMWQVGFMATAFLYKYLQPSIQRENMGEIRVSLTFEKQCVLSSTCSECQLEVWCPHVVAAILYRIRNSDQVAVYAPMTETLSTLDRTQLQKLLQYAVQEDPAGILGRVFKHLDAVRDSSSDLNTIEGAPDPTFGGCYGRTTQWQLSLERMEKNLAADMKSMCDCDHAYYGQTSCRSTSYPETHSETERCNSKMYAYIKKALQMHQTGNTEHAVAMFLKILDRVIKQLNGSSRCRTLGRLCHDLVQIMSLFIIHPSLSKSYKEQIVNHARQCQKDTAALSSLIAYKHSMWADLPCLASLYQDKLKKDERVGLLTELLCAAKLPDWPKDLRSLLLGEVSLDESDYNEDVRVMLMRLESLRVIHDKKSTYSHIEQARYAYIILRPLAASALKGSIVGAFLQKLGSDSVEAQTVMSVLGNTVMPQPAVIKKPEEPQPSTSKGTPLGKRKYPKRKNRGTKRPRLMAEMKDKQTETVAEQAVLNCPEFLQFVSNLSKGQIAFSIMSMCDILIKPSSHKELTSEVKHHLLGYCLLGLEASRFRLANNVGNDVSTTDHARLLLLEQRLQEFVLGKNALARPALNLFLDAWRGISPSFYAPIYPLVLLDTVLFMSVRDDDLKVSRAEHILQVCADLLMESTAPLGGFRLVSSYTLDNLIKNLTWDPDSLSRSRHYHGDLAFNKFHMIIVTFFNILNPDDENHITLAVKVLAHLSKYTDGKLLRLVAEQLRLHAAKLQASIPLAEGMLYVVLQTYRVDGRTSMLYWGGSYSPDFGLNFICSLFRRLGTPSLRHLVDCWQSILRARDLKVLLMQLETDIHLQKKLQPEVITLIHQYYAAQEHHDNDPCALLGFFKVGDANYQKAVWTICGNAKWFPQGTLFEIAQKNITNESSSSSNKKGKSSETISEDTFKILDAAVAQLTVAREFDITDKTYSNIDWLCSICCDKSEHFQRFLKMVKNCRQPTILVRVLQYMDKMGSVLNEHKAQLLDSLLESYKEYFGMLLTTCGHAAYARVINEMHRARSVCIQYGHLEGDRRFDTEVVAPVRKKHSSKRKLMRMMEGQFNLQALPPPAAKSKNKSKK